MGLSADTKEKPTRRACAALREAGRSRPAVAVLTAASLLIVVCGSPPTSRVVSQAPPFPTVPGRSQSPVPTSSPIVIRGTGHTATGSITLPAPISVAHFTHDGRSSFVVQAFVGGQGDLLINTVGAYDGSRPLFEGSPVQLDIQADGAWTVTITAMTCCAASGELAGSGDAVSNQFNPPGRQAWEFSNSGQRSYVVYAHCVGGDQLVLSRIGAVRGSMVVQFGRGPCYWEVLSDGSWSIRPD